VLLVIVVERQSDFALLLTLRNSETPVRDVPETSEPATFTNPWAEARGTAGDEAALLRRCGDGFEAD
jgi:hypothetical protein